MLQMLGHKRSSEKGSTGVYRERHVPILHDNLLLFYCIMHVFTYHFHIVTHSTFNV